METIKDLENRGLLQYDKQAKHYDLHPVVRGVASGRLAQTEKETYGQRVVDHFSSRPHNPYEQAETLEDVSDVLHVVRTLVQMGRFQEADDAYSNDIANTLLYNLEEYAGIVALLRPFFPDRLGDTATAGAQYLAPRFSRPMQPMRCRHLGQEDEAFTAYTSSLVAASKAKKMERNVGICLINISQQPSRSESAREGRPLLAA